jgi:hypothetical protein
MLFMYVCLQLITLLLLLLLGTWCTKERPFEHHANLMASDRLLVYADRTNVRFPSYILNRLMNSVKPDGIEPEDEVTLREEEERLRKLAEEESMNQKKKRKRRRHGDGTSSRKQQRSNLKKYRTVTMNERRWIPDVKSQMAIQMVSWAVVLLSS